MIGLIIAAFIFNVIAFKTNKKLTGNQILQIWTFTIAFELIFDIFIDLKYHAYWYFRKGIGWEGLLPHLLIVPPVNIMFLGWFPHNSKLVKKITYFIIFVISILIYEKIALFPEPWGYFHYNWWTIWHSAIMDPFLLFILIWFYKWICKLESNAAQRLNKS